MKQHGSKRSNPDAAEPLKVSVPENAYYESVSERYGIAQVILYLALLAFVAISFLSNTGFITYQNLYYFVKDLGASAETVDVLHTNAVSYPADKSQSFTLYRQGLAVAGNTSVTVFTATGRQALSKLIQYQNPVAVGSGKYLLVYELGGTQYSLYNSYTQIFSGAAELPIRGAAISPCGMYALVSQSQQSPSVVELYSSDFERIGRYPFSSYVTDASISEKGTYLAIVTSEAQAGTFSTSVHVYEPGRTEKLSELRLGDSLGLSCAFTDSGDLAILCGNGVYYTTVRGKLIMEHSFEGKNISCADVGADGCAVALKKIGNSTENQIIVFDKSGKMLYNEAVTEAVESTAICQGAVYFMQTDGILRIRTHDGEKSKLQCVTDQRVMLAVDSTRVLLCAPQKAVYLQFGF